MTMEFGIGNVASIGAVILVAAVGFATLYQRKQAPVGMSANYEPCQVVGQPIRPTCRDATVWNYISPCENKRRMADMELAEISSGQKYTPFSNVPDGPIFGYVDNNDIVRAFYGWSVLWGYDPVAKLDELKQSRSGAMPRCDDGRLPLVRPTEIGPDNAKVQK